MKKYQFLHSATLMVTKATWLNIFYIVHIINLYLPNVYQNHNDYHYLISNVLPLYYHNIIVLTFGVIEQKWVTSPWGNPHLIYIIKC